jgi:hypothetical protein
VVRCDRVRRATPSERLLALLVLVLELVASARNFRRTGSSGGGPQAPSKPAAGEQFPSVYSDAAGGGRGDVRWTRSARSSPLPEPVGLDLCRARLGPTATGGQ